MNIKNEIANYVSESKIPVFAITDTENYQRALPGWHPKDLMPRVESILIFGLPFIEHPKIVDEKTHIADKTW